MRELELINPENVSEKEAKNYPVREAARAVVIDGDKKIALLHVSKANYYKLPGGGIEEGEDQIAALRRECKEEVGCDIDVLCEIGSIVEYRRMFDLKQISYCYLAKVRGEKGGPSLEEGEIEEGFEQVWLPYDEALHLLTENKATNPEGGKYIVPRDTIFLKEAKKLFD